MNDITCVCPDSNEERKVKLIDDEYCAECHMKCEDCEFVQEWENPIIFFYECSQCGQGYTIVSKCIRCINTKRKKEWRCDSCLLDELQ